MLVAARRPGFATVVIAADAAAARRAELNSVSAFAGKSLLFISNSAVPALRCWTPGHQDVHRMYGS